MTRPTSLLIDQISRITDIATGDKFLQSVSQHFDALNISYHGLNFSNPTHNDFLILHTYSSEWEQHYVENSLFNNDPILRHGVSNITPTDWAQLANLSKKEKEFLAQARDFGLGKRGLTFSSRGKFGDIGIFSVNTNHCKSKWESYKVSHISDLHMLATYFHEKMFLTQEVIQQEKAKTLSDRELECLKWCTAGKSYWETSVILGISERTVNFHMTTVRNKLNAMSNAQAVAKALVQGIVSLG